MSNARDIRESIKVLANSQAVRIEAAEVVSADARNGCTVELLDSGLRVHNVRLRATNTADTGLITVPAEGSQVLIAKADRRSFWIILLETELEQLSLKIGNTEAVIDADGYKLERSGENLIALLDELLTAIQQLTVTTGVGPSGVPINLSAFIDLQTRLSKLDAS